MGGREHRCVVDELGDQVDDVGDGRSVQVHTGDALTLDAGVVTGFGDGSAQHVDERHGAVPGTAGCFTTEDEQVFGVASRAGRQVVEFEQLGELFRVLLLTLHLVQQAQLSVDQRLVAVGDVEEHAIDTVA